MLPTHVLKNYAIRNESVRPVISAFVESLPVIAECGYPVIVDFIIGKRSWLEMVLQVLAPYEVYFVSLDCAVEILEERGDSGAPIVLGWRRSCSNVRSNLNASICG